MAHPTAVVIDVIRIVLRDGVTFLIFMGHFETDGGGGEPPGV